LIFVNDQRPVWLEQIPIAGRCMVLSDSTMSGAASCRRRRWLRRLVARALRFRPGGPAAAARAETERWRRLAEEANHQLLEAQRIGKLGHWITDELARTVAWSPQMFAITGLPPQPVMRLDLSRLPPTHPDDRPVFLRTRERATATGETVKVEVRFVRPNGDIRWVQIQMRAHYDAAGRLMRLFGTTQDITERKEAEDALKAAREQLTDAIEAFSEGFVLFDRDDRFVLTNTNFRRLYADRTDLFAPGTRYEDMLRQSVARGGDHLGDDPETWIGKMVAWHQACGEPMVRQGPDGRWIRQVERRTRDGGIVGIRTDITEQVLAERALREAKQAAEAANLAKSQFLANMSHELRTPLNAIIGFSEMIEDAMKGPLAPDYREYGRFIRQSGEHLHAIINDILDLAKVDAGKFELRAEAGVDPRRIAEACVTLVRGHAEAGGVGLASEIEDRLPLLVADPTRLKQILLNLLSNAVKFTEAGGSVTLAIRRAADGAVVFEVQDTGAGMTAAEIAIALEPFAQVDAGYTRRQEGTGLGLPLARRLTELHGGTLSIDSAKGRGTTVTVRLPAPPASDRPSAAGAAVTMLADPAG
jgi:PAS domain S-box-containing protein